MSTGLLIGIIILLLVVGVPLVQAIIRWVQRRRSLGVEGVASLHAAGLRSEDLPTGLSAQERAAVTSEEIALAERDVRLCPGVPELLQALQGEDVVLGLGTGNFRRAAEAKLGPLGIWEYFVDGGFGDDAPDRTELLAAGLERLRAGSSDGADVVVIGDTGHDVEAGQAIGARVVAVRTGYARPGELDAAEVVLDDLSDTEQSLRALLGN